MQEYSVAKLAKRLKLKNYTPEIDLEHRYCKTSDVNRPALELTGFFEHFSNHRIQIIGTVEHTYLTYLTKERRIEIYTQLLSYDIPCVIICRNFDPGEVFLTIAKEKGVPVFGTEQATSSFLSDVIYLLRHELAESIAIHGVLVDVFGEGLLITGESGIGKSEAALELVHRGHRLVTDDIVEIRRISDNHLVGSSPEITRGFIEVRGIGIIDVKTLYGVECIKESQNIDFVIHLEEWKREKKYDRLGMQEEFRDILGCKIPCHSVPIRPGRNVAVICETAAVNHRQRKMGYNAAEELYRRVEESVKKRGTNDGTI